jgi:hypothetical protein
MFGTLMHRQPHLTVTAVLLLALGLATGLMQTLDHRLFEGVNVWVKPTKFFVAVAILCATNAWFFGYVRPERRNSAPMRAVVWITIIAGTLECLYIAFQASRAEASHFNETDTLHIMLYGMMGMAIVILMCTLLVLAWEIARRPVPGLRADYRVAVIAGLVLTFILGGGFAGYLSSQTGHYVGEIGGHFPFFGWNRAGGDLRVAHFFGTHLHQALPIAAAILAPLPTPLRWLGLAAATLAGIALTVFTFCQALAGQPFLPGAFAS